MQGGRKSIVLVLAMVCLLFAGSHLANVVLQRNSIKSQNLGTESTVYDYHIAMIGSNPYDDFWVSVYQGAYERGKENGCFVENFGENLDRDYSVRELLDMAVAAKVDGILVEADGGEKMNALIGDAAEQGIPVMTVLSDAPGSKRVSFVSGNYFALGEMYGSQLIKEVEKKTVREEGRRNVRITILKNPGDKHSAQNLIYSGIREKTAPVAERMELSVVSIDDSGKFESEETVRDLVLGEKQPDILVCLSAVDTISAFQCIVDYNMVGKISIIGYHSSKEILEEIQKGIVKSTISINAEKMGQIALDGMYEYLSRQYVSEYLQADSELITMDNVNLYIEEEE